MKKFFLFLLLLGTISCTTTSDNPDLPQNKINNVEIVFTTTEPNTDEIMITYYDIAKADNVSGPHNFVYDNDGKPLPLVLKFDDYKYKFLDGEAFRNNFSTSELRVQIYVNGELIVERFDRGTSTTFATVDISFRILN
ncbi:hypothetical protein [Polaribacter gangjinensis]|uniref:Uncharacterized protein n=1 Tax=Polaribacter gangjinensis TaxID=574710 RepID=A0A2S7WCU5_9FLAO|nr:hypothetical protein [Polaribacter gangjinensis]PQJ75081.1 hypothetical protein BTO13_07370 [Polaribacter gangjinensis]